MTLLPISILFFNLLDNLLQLLCEEHSDFEINLIWAPVLEMCEKGEICK